MNYLNKLKENIINSVYLCFMFLLFGLYSFGIVSLMILFLFFSPIISLFDKDILTLNKRTNEGKLEIDFKIKGIIE
jgi:hypothetical protein